MTKVINVAEAKAHLPELIERADRDPFDRILVAQAMIERLTLVSKDPLVGRYDIRVVWH